MRPRGRLPPLVLYPRRAPCRSAGRAIFGQRVIKTAVQDLLDAYAMLSLTSGLESVSCGNSGHTEVPLQSKALGGSAGGADGGTCGASSDGTPSDWDGPSKRSGGPGPRVVERRDLPSAPLPSESNFLHLADFVGNCVALLTALAVDKHNCVLMRDEGIAAFFLRRETGVASCPPSVFPGDGENAESGSDVGKAIAFPRSTFAGKFQRLGADARVTAGDLVSAGFRCSPGYRWKVVRAVQAGTKALHARLAASGVAGAGCV